MQSIKLNDGNKIPQIGFGVFLIPPDGETERAVASALECGYRHIDTAAAYLNEADVGRAVRASGLPREEIFVTSKLWLQDYGYEAAKKGIDASLAKLGLDYIDLYLLHQPYFDTLGAWRALEEAKKAGKIKSIGLSNHTIGFLEKLLPKMEIKPAVNQMECNPLFQQKALREYMSPHGIALETWYPIGHGSAALTANRVIAEIAAAHGKSAVQTILRWHVQEGFVALPKSTNPAHIKANIDIFDFALTEDEMNRIRALDTGVGSHNPDDPSNGPRLLSNYKIHD